MKRPIKEISVHVVLIGLVGFFLIESFSIRGSAAGGSLPPAFFPKVISIILIGLLAISLAKVVYQIVVFRGEAVSVSQKTLAPVVSWVAVLFQLFIYAAVLESLGYVISTSLMIFCVIGTLVVFGRDGESKVSAKGAAKLAVFSITLSSLIFLLFSAGFGIRLPTFGVMGV